MSDLLPLLQGDVQLIAGCTDWYPAKTPGALQRTLIDVTRVAEMRGIAREGAGWRIGGAATWTDVIRAELPSAFDGLKAAAHEVGSVQIQNAGTVAGNICNASPAADGVPPLLTLEAEVLLSSNSGQRRVALGDFITGVRQTTLRPGEVVQSLFVPDVPSNARSGFEKLGARRYLVISITMVAGLIVLDDAGLIDRARIAVGACSPVAERQPLLEAALAGRHPAEITVTPDMLGALSPISDVRADAAYRLEAAAIQCTTLLRRLGA